MKLNRSPSSMTEFKEIEHELKRYDRFAVLSHRSPEADATGSQLSINRMLRKMGKRTIAINQDGVPSNLTFLKGYQAIKKPSEVGREAKDLDAAIVLDCGTLDRIGDQAQQLISGLPVINIDHHADNPHYGDVNCVIDVAATTMIIFELGRYLGFEIDEPLANALYAGILADTGSFANTNVTSNTLKIAGELVKLGAQARPIAVHLFESTPFSKQKLLGRVLGSSHFENQIVWGEVTQELLDEIGSSMDDTDGIVHQLRATKGARAALLFKELPEDQVKISLRSKNGVDVSRIARKFGGGGHQSAAGCMVAGSLEQVRTRVLERVQQAVHD